MNKSEIISIIGKYGTRAMSPEESIRLEEWLKNVSPDEFHATLDECQILPASLKSYHSISSESARKLEALLDDLDAQESGRGVESVPVYSLYWKKWIAAAAIFIAVGTGGYFLFLNRAQKKLTPENYLQAHDVKAPASNNAVITLSNGRQIILDSTGKGMLASQGNVQIIKSGDGQIAYSGSSNEIAYNTLTNPRGSKVVSLSLSDGTRVWLNNESSLRYPTAFIGAERKVEITGEAYFEVAHNPSSPFIVTKGNAKIKVLGTHFNVNAYDDEDAINVTLLEGSVQVSTRSNRQLLLPGQQSRVSPRGNIDLNKNADIEQVMSWKNGVFNFNSSDIKMVMRQLARWYDIEVIYEGQTTSDKFGGGITRTANLSQILEILESSRVHFRLEGKKLTVLP